MVKDWAQNKSAKLCRIKREREKKNPAYSSMKRGNLADETNPKNKDIFF